jgi:phosphoglycerate dehydrogenase-like enzyme
MTNVLFTGCSFSKETIEQFEQKNVHIIPGPMDFNEDQLTEALKNAEIYILGGYENATAKVIESNPHLKLIIFMGTGFERYVDTAMAKKLHIPVAYTPNANAVSTAEHTVSLMLDLLKKVSWLNSTTKQGKWLKRTTWDLHGRTLGIIGMGHVGYETAKILKNGFGMNIIFYNRSKKENIIQELSAKQLPLDEVLSRSDIISIHTKYCPDTVGMINQANLTLMKPSSLLINCARVEIVDFKSLSLALTNNVIAGAAMDGYYQEPALLLTDSKSKLLGFPDDKLIITPHVASFTTDAIENMNKMIIENLEAYLNNQKQPYPIPD